MKTETDIKKNGIVHYLSVILPLIVVIVLLVLAVVLGLIPSIEKYTIDTRKKQTMELVRTVWSITSGVYEQVQNGSLVEEDAKEIVISHVRQIRYGIEMKDYCWIHNMESEIISHPYESNINFSEYTDKNGLKFVPAMNQIILEKKEGFLSYFWQWNDDPGRTEKKISFVKGFEPWGWVIGSGFYEEDILGELRGIIKPILLWTLVGLALVSALLFIPLRKSLQYIRTIVEKETEIQKLLGIIKNSPISIVITDLNGNIEYVNPHTIKTYGWDEKKLKSSNVRLFKSNLVKRSTYEDLWKTVTSGKTWKGELPNCNKKGDLIWEDIVVAPIRDDNGIITNYYAIKRDISEHKKLQNSLLEAKNKAEESDQLKSLFLNNFSHEIRTPLNAILGYSDFLKNEPSISNDLKEVVNVIEQNSAILLKIVNQILRVSEIEAQGKSEKMEFYNLDKLLIKSLELSLKKSPHQPSDKVDFQHNFDEQLKDKKVCTHKKFLTEILSSIILNAIKFTDSGKITIGYRMINEEISIFVKDTGCGICQSDRPHIFKKFFQGNTKFLSLHEGTGLGLTIAERLAHLLGGKITFESQEGVGTEFQILGLCIQNNPHEETSEEPSKLTPNGP